MTWHEEREELWHGLKEDVPDLTAYHCTIHQSVPCTNLSEDYVEVMNTMMKLIDFLRASSSTSSCWENSWKKLRQMAYCCTTTWDVAQYRQGVGTLLVHSKGIISFPCTAQEPEGNTVFTLKKRIIRIEMQDESKMDIFLHFFWSKSHLKWAQRETTGQERFSLWFDDICPTPSRGNWKCSRRHGAHVPKGTDSGRERCFSSCWLDRWADWKRQKITLTASSLDSSSFF